MEGGTSLLSTSVVVGILVLTCLVIGAALYFGLLGKGDLVLWRTIKLCSVLTGVISLVLLALAFDKNVRDATAQRYRDYANREFVNLRLRVKDRIESSCSDVTHLEECKAMMAFQSSIEQAYLGGNAQLEPDALGVIEYSFVGDKLVWGNESYHLLGMVENINKAITVAANAERSWEKVRRWTLLAGLIVLSCSIAGSVGEAAFQLAQARAARKVVA
jgi:hypothetical protein